MLTPSSKIMKELSIGDCYMRIFSFQSPSVLVIENIDHSILTIRVLYTYIDGDRLKSAICPDTFDMFIADGTLIKITEKEYKECIAHVNIRHLF